MLGNKLAPVDTSSSLQNKLPHQTDALLHQAVALGDIQAMAAMGRFFFSQKQFKKALPYFEKAAPHSPAAAQNVELIKARIALESSDSSATATASPHGLDAQSIYLQARRLHRGDGVPANYTEAIRLYMLADRLGYREARKMLSLIYSRPQPTGEIDVGWMRQLADMDLTLPSPRMTPSSSTLILHEDSTPLFDFLPVPWRN